MEINDPRSVLSRLSKDAADGDSNSGTKPCPTCKGTGKIRGGHVKCPDCNGTGKVPATADKGE